jgi:hypothetical protein
MSMHAAAVSTAVLKCKALWECRTLKLQAAASLTSGPKIVAFHMYKLSSEIGLAEHLQILAAAATAAAWVRGSRG